MEAGTAGRMNWIRFAAICGMAAPLTFFGTVLLLGFLRPDYSPVTQLMSELGVAGSPYAIVMNLAGLALTGILLIIYSTGIHAVLGKYRGGIPGSLLVAIVGLAFAGTAIFSCDTGCVAVTTAGELHGLLGMIGMFAAAISAFFLASAMRESGEWNRYWQYSLITGVVILLLAFLSPSFADVRGLVQRLMVGTAFLWAGIIAIRLYRGAGKPAPGGGG
jgi:hypothetical membrane protein